MDEFITKIRGACHYEMRFPNGDVFVLVRAGKFWRVGDDYLFNSIPDARAAAAEWDAVLVRVAH